MLTGQTKVDYQREYMRQRRIDLKKGHNAIIEPKTKIEPEPENAPGPATIDEHPVVRPNIPLALNPINVRPELPIKDVQPPCPNGYGSNQWNYIWHYKRKEALEILRQAQRL
jgi:hypothetical protein